MQMDVYKTLYPFHTTKKMSHCIQVEPGGAYELQLCQKGVLSVIFYSFC